MQTIRNQQDIDTLFQKNTPPDLVNHIESFLDRLLESLSSTDLEPCIITHIESGDNLLERCRFPEFVELIDLGEHQAYRIGVMPDNEYMLTYFTLKGIHDEETELWLKEQAERI